MCVKCRADVTFARRSQDSKGRYLCLNCAKASETSIGAASISKGGGSSASADNRPPPPQRNPVAAAQPVTLQKAGAQSNDPRGTRRRSARQKKIIFWIIGVGVALVAVVSASFFLLRPTWEEQNRAQIITMKTDADGLLQNGHADAAYARYKALFAFVGDHEIHGDFIKTELAIAKSGMENAYAKAAPLIEKEEEEARARAAEQQRIADERHAAELAQQHWKKLLVSSRQPNKREKKRKPRNKIEWPVRPRRSTRYGRQLGRSF